MAETMPTGTATVETGEALSLRDLLEKPSTDFPDTPDLPGGKTFFGKLLDMSSGFSRNKGTPHFRFNIRLTDPGKDVPVDWLDNLKKLGLSLGDYNTYQDFYLTPNAMKIFSRFSDSLGFDPNKSTRERFKLDENYNPTAETQDLIRGREVICTTQAKGDNGRVFLNLDRIAGIKRG
jgi:hypothetical protein